MKNTNKIISCIIAIILVAFAIYFLRDIRLIRGFNIHKIREYINASGHFAPIVFILIFTIRTLLIVLPYTVFIVLGGRVFGPLQGFIYSTIASFLCATMAFYIARTIGRSIVQKYLGDKLKGIESKIEKHGFKVIFAMRISALFHFDIFSYVVGLTTVNYRAFILGTMLGVLPEIFVLNYLGHNLGNFRSKKFILAVVLFVIVAGIPFVYKRMKKEK